jgi:hypothetical protein
MCANSTISAPVPIPFGEALATLAHELRDPLATVVLALDLQLRRGVWHGICERGIEPPTALAVGGALPAVPVATD